jgi:cation transport regulator ChaB
MPYPTNASEPAAVKARIKEPVRQRQWRKVFNSVLAANPGDESRAFASAWSATKKAGGVLKSRAKN